MSLRRLIALLLVCLPAFGCSVGTKSVSPQPEPPAVTPEINPELLAIDDTTGNLVGLKGAISPGKGQLSVVDLDATAPPVLFPVTADGTFDAPIPQLGSGDEFRLEALLDGERSEPVDVAVFQSIIEAELGPASRPLEDCFIIDPPFLVDAGAVNVGESATTSVVLTNECGDDIVVDGLTFRAASPGWTATPATPLTIADGASQDVEVTFAPSAAGASEDTLFVEIASPATGRRPITVVGEGK